MTKAFALNELERALALWPDTDFDAPLEPEEYYPYMERKLGERFAHLQELKEEFAQKRDPAKLQAMLDYAYDEGIYYDMTMRGSYHNQLSFLSLLNVLPDDRELKLLDLGAGDGNIDIALAQLMPNLTIYAVERNAGALRRMEQSITSDVQGRVIPVRADYEKDSLPAADLTIAVNPPGIFEILPSVTTPQIVMSFDGHGYDRSSIQYGTMPDAAQMGFLFQVLDQLYFAPEQSVVTGLFIAR
jgi:hypothetical protein